jgi:hypothetical protein
MYIECRSVTHGKGVSFSMDSPATKPHLNRPTMVSSQVPTYRQPHRAPTSTRELDNTQDTQAWPFPAISRVRMECMSFTSLGYGITLT